jgi:CDP-diacylglycerol--glycerol-3-phosphate 3-phosphatidyltransferase
MITCAQRLHTVRHSPGAADPMPPTGAQGHVQPGEPGQVQPGKGEP